MRTGYIKTTNVSQGDATNMSAVKSIEVVSTEPTGTSARYLLKPDGGSWMKYNTTSGAFEAAATQTPTDASALSEGNTKAEVQAITSTEKLAIFAGKKVDVFVGISADDTATEMPTFTNIIFHGTTGSTVLETKVTSDAIKLTETGKAVEILDIKTVTSYTANASAAVNVSVQNENGEWSEYADYTKYITSPATKAVSIKFQGKLTVDSVGTAEASISSVTIKHRTEDVAVFTEGTGTCISQTYTFTEEMTGAHLMIKHPTVLDTVVNAYITLRAKPVSVTGELLGEGTGASQTATLKNTTNVASHGFTLYFDDEPQPSSMYAMSSSDAKVTWTAPAGKRVTADYIYNWQKENFVAMSRDASYPDTLNPDMVEEQFNYQATADTDPKGAVAAVRIDLEQKKGTVTDEAIGVGNGALQSFTLAHKAKDETLVVKIDGVETNEYTYKEATRVLFVTAAQGKKITASYKWAADIIDLDSIACVFIR